MSDLIESETHDRYAVIDIDEHMNDPAYTGTQLAQAYRDGATRRHTPAEINAAAERLYQLTHDTPWDQVPEYVHGTSRAMIRTILDTMDATMRKTHERPAATGQPKETTCASR